MISDARWVGPRGPQVVTELDIMTAICDYIVHQLDNRFREEYGPGGEDGWEEVIDLIIDNLKNPWRRESVELMQQYLGDTGKMIGGALVDCRIEGCTQADNHKFLEEFLDLLWHARERTGEWLRGQGIVPGQSAN